MESESIRTAACRLVAAASIFLLSFFAAGAARPTPPLRVSSASAPSAAAPAAPNYSIDAIRYATIPKFPLDALVMGAPKDQTLDIAMVFWLIRGGGRTILFDSGMHRENWIKEFGMTDFLSPDKCLEAIGVAPSSVTDVIISHAHWDHMGGIDLFPNAAIWIQRDEFAYYTGAAWQPPALSGDPSSGKHGGIDPEDVLELVRRNTAGKLHLVAGDNIEIIPGIRAYTGGHHTFASQYILVEGNPAYVLASDNLYLYENLRSHRASATFDPSFEKDNVAAQSRMVELAGSADRVVPGHDPALFTKFPSQGRIAHIR